METNIETARMALDADDLDTVFAVINRALEHGEDSADIMELLARALLKAGLEAEAAEAYENAAVRSASLAHHFWKEAALIHDRLKDRDRAFIAAMKAQKAKDGDPDIIFILARELAAREENELLAHFRNRLTASDKLEHLELAASLIGAEGRNPFTLPLFKKLAALSPDDDFAQFKLMSVAREFCDFATIVEQERWLADAVAKRGPNVYRAETAYSNLLHCADEALNQLASNHGREILPFRPENSGYRRGMDHRWGKKLRIGYFSNDFSSVHATMRLLRRVLELHDREKFEITLYCYTPADLIARDDGGRSQWGRIVPVGHLDPQEMAARVRDDEIDILVDLKGFTGGSRCHWLNLPMAPVHVSWLGFPGSLSGVDIDYAIADRNVLPDSSRQFYREKFARLPHCYQPNDNAHRLLPAARSRAELGLPWHRFVFASFNANRKISLKTAELWSRILVRVPSSVLWVMVYHDIGKDNFRSFMEARGIRSDRIIFCDEADYEEHLARVQAADLCLDTFPYNGHTTTSDMLWAGVPVLTMKGTNFASRVSQSLLETAGLGELVAEDETAFVESAVEIAASLERKIQLKSRVIERRSESPLFDANLFCRNLETAFLKMAEAARMGLPPDHFDL